MRVVEHAQQEVKLLRIVDLEYVVAYQLVHQILPQLRCDLQGVHSEAEQYLRDALDVLVLYVLVQLGLVLHHHHFGNFVAVRLALVDEYFVVLGQLQLVVLDGFGEFAAGRLSDSLLTSLSEDSSCSRLTVTPNTCLLADSTCPYLRVNSLASR